MDTTKQIPENAVLDRNDAPILFSDYYPAGECCCLVGDYLGYQIEHRKLSDGQHCLVPNDSYRQKAPTISERTVIEAFAWQCKEHFLGLKRNEHVTFPKLITPCSDDEANGYTDNLVFQNEGRAYRFAEVAESLFNVSAEVVELPTGWGVTVSSGQYSLCSQVLAELQGACRLMSEYALGKRDRAVDIHAIAFDSKSRAAWRSRRHAQADRIEAGINAILERLAHPSDTHTLPGGSKASTERENAQNKPPRKNAPADGTEKHTRPARKSTPKKSA